MGLDLVLDPLIIAYLKFLCQGPTFFFAANAVYQRKRKDDSTHTYLLRAWHEVSRLRLLRSGEICLKRLCVLLFGLDRCREFAKQRMG